MWEDCSVPLVGVAAVVPAPVIVAFMLRYD
jgi:hypothetical protein